MSKQGPSSLPYRQATRLQNEFQFGVVAIGVSVVGHNLDPIAALWLIYRSALRSGPYALISNVAIASSLSRPRETMRRHTLALVRMGLLEADGARFRLAPGFLDRPEIVAAGDELLSLFTSMVDGLDRAGFKIPATFATQSRAVKLIAALDVDLAAFELSESRLPNSMTLYVMGAITVINASGITHDPELSERYGYAHTPPPLELRRPATVTDIATHHGFSYATTWRHVAALEKAEAISAVKGGYVLHNRWIDNDDTSALSREKINHVMRVLARTVPEGTA